MHRIGRTDELRYVPVWVKSNYSFLEGASHPEELVERASELGLPAMTLSDRDGVYGIARAHVRAKELGIPLIVGTQLTVGITLETAHPIVLLAQDKSGYGNMCRIISQAHARCPKGRALAHIEEILARDTGLLALCPDVHWMSELRAAFEGRIYAVCTRHHRAADVASEQRLRTLASRLEIPLLGAVEVLYHDRSRRPLQDVLTCIRTHTTLNTAGQWIRGNAEHELKPPTTMHQLFSDEPGLVHRTLEVADRCRFSLDQLRYRYPAERIPDGLDEIGWLEELCRRGAVERYHGDVSADATAQLNRELALINELEYGGYFLTMWEIVQFCRNNDIVCQGRGSAANSIVCYCLGITAIDPLRMDLLFERFLSRERAEPPDIDLDIEHDRREQVIQWVYQRYGRDKAAMVANVIRYRMRSAVREVGKALGVPLTALDRLAKTVERHGDRFDPTILTHAGLDPHTPVHSHLLRISSQIVDFPRHLSIHPGGFLLGHDPVDTLVPIENASMEDRTVIQWDKYDVEALGLFKVDLLGLGALTQIHGCLDLLRMHEHIDLEMATVPQEDPATYAMICRADTVGTFQIESRAQMAMLPRLLPRTFYDLVIEVAIVRPGPIQGDMVHPYLRRRSGKEDVVFPHPSLERVLAKTLGVPIFQEQVMKLAVLAAGYTPGESDQLRRDMAAWRSSGRIEQHRERLIEGMVERGIGRDFAERVFSQIRGFGEYGFPESHAASFALIAYVTCWLRCHHFAAFTCSLLNAQPMGFYSAATIVDDAKRHGIEVRAIDVQSSQWDCTLEADGSPHRFAVRMGLRYVKGLGLHERAALARGCGPYQDLAEFVRQTRLSRKALQRLAEAGAFASIETSRRNALWDVRALATTIDDALGLPTACVEQAEQPVFAALERSERVAWDYRSSSHSTHAHPVECLRPQLLRHSLPDAATVRELPNGRKVRYLGLVICRQRPGTASGVVFCTLEDETGFVNVVIWNDVFERHAMLAKTSPLLGVSGKIQAADGVVHIIADELWTLEFAHEPAPTRSRDFH